MDEPIALTQFSGEYLTTSLLIAASTMTIVPVLIVYVLAQKYFIQGIATSGLK